jgi:hypothetical protein
MGMLIFPPCGFVRMATIESENAGFRLVSSKFPCFGQAVRRDRIILFCGMLPLIWSFDHFYFEPIQKITDVHGWAA